MKWETKTRLQGNTEELETDTHKYVLFFDPTEKMFKVIYIENATDKTGSKLWSTKEQAKDWAENVHIPAKAK